MARDDHPRPISRRRKANPVLRACLFWVGALLVVLSPLVGIIPGPGGVPVFALGAALMLRNSRWAKKVYARHKTRHPKKAAWADWALRRQSHFRRTERDKARTAAAAGLTTARVVLTKHREP